MRYYGSKAVPQDIRRRRINVAETMRRVGTPIIVKHMYTVKDVDSGVAQPSQNMSKAYNQPRHNDPISHGIGYSSVELSDNEWITPTGNDIIVSGSNPGAGYIRAPKYRGFGPGYLTYAVLPDVAEDYFKLSNTGALIKVQSAQVQMAWFPDVNDNDLIITCRVDRNFQVIETYERYQAKMTNPISIRGLDRQGRREYSEDFGNRHVIGQTFEMSLIPENDELMKVEVDR